jgi:Ca2+:H+ antiporter
MNKQHPFGLPIWKPALYKKSRSVVRKANSALHSSPTSSSEFFLYPGNLLWLTLFGWWLALIIFIVSLPFSLFQSPYGMIMRELGLYLLWPFGRYVERLVEITPSVMNNLERERSAHSSILVDDDNEFDVDEEGGLLDHHHQHHKRKRYNWFKAIHETLQLGPSGVLYYLVFFAIIGKLILSNGKTKRLDLY